METRIVIVYGNVSYPRKRIILSMLSRKFQSGRSNIYGPETKISSNDFLVTIRSAPDVAAPPLLSYTIANNLL